MAGLKRVPDGDLGSGGLNLPHSQFHGCFCNKKENKSQIPVMCHRCEGAAAHGICVPGWGRDLA